MHLKADHRINENGIPCAGELSNEVARKLGSRPDLDAAACEGHLGELYGSLKHNLSERGAEISQGGGAQPADALSMLLVRYGTYEGHYEGSKEATACSGTETEDHDWHLTES